ncbi:MAG: hypothetical protein ACRDZ9_07220 [Acidimicrobiales bacterium]
MRRFRVVWWSVVASVVLAACGGGDGSSSTEDGPGPVASEGTLPAACSTLQREFDRALEAADGLEPGSDRRSEALRGALEINDKLRELGC